MPRRDGRVRFLRRRGASLGSGWVDFACSTFSISSTTAAWSSALPPTIRPNSTRRSSSCWVSTTTRRSPPELRQRAVSRPDGRMSTRRRTPPTDPSQTCCPCPSSGAPEFVNRPPRGDSRANADCRATVPLLGQRLVGFLASLGGDRSPARRAPVLALRLPDPLLEGRVLHEAVPAPAGVPHPRVGQDHEEQ